MKSYIYVASSWRNTYQPGMVRILREAGFTVYDFKTDGFGGFTWDDIDTLWRFWRPDQAIAALHDERCERAFDSDIGALDKATALVLCSPCGISAHLELGYAAGKGIPTAIFYDLAYPVDPELMTKVADFHTTDYEALVTFLRSVHAKSPNIVN